MTEQTQRPSLYQLFKQALRGDVQHDFTKGSIGIAAFLLAVPMVLEMAMESIFAIVDIFFVASLGFEAVAVVGLTEAVLTILYAVAIGLSMGITALIARRIGEGNPKKANQVAGQALWVGMLVSMLVAFVGLIYSQDILRLMGADEKVLAVGADYTLVMLCGSITILYLFLINAIFRGAGDASVAMRSLWLANGLNIVLDPLLIYGIGPFPEMGVTGAAVATTIGRGVGVLYQLYHLRGHASRIKVGLAELKPQLEVMLGLIKVSIGGILQFLIATASWVALVRIVSTYGSAAVAGYTIAIRVVIFTILPAWGMSNAVATLVGQNLGAGKPDRAEQSVWRIARYNLYFMLSVAVVFILFAEFIIGLFSTDPAVIRDGVNCLRFVAYGYGFYGIGMIVVQAFNGAGDTMTPTRINFLCYWMLQIPLAYSLAKYAGLGTNGVFMAITIAESLLAVVGIWYFRRGHWKTKTV
ncbi:MATE family efflux transporter [Bowmanella yangjiangensis]|uniref:Multidrug-efflux transporter n=1 Tax=Bowmanella yangjiangensis TaxID=2811230 RepID=A0ABS3CQN0_9ALTE|nr:MATE family efflux transporter [Bowmanella yangjiangensis]MBN7818985.1 MATE family efflux transporter [Bowmanella yangjiangensis]